MPFQIIRNDITKVTCDAIVNAANESLLGGGGVDGAIHRAAGPELLAECRTLGGCDTGSAKITKGYRLPCKYVIHTVGPIWRGGFSGEKEKLESCYRNSLQLALEHQCESIAFPLISAGVYQYPVDQAMKIAIDQITKFLEEHEMLVYLVIFDKKAVISGQKRFAEIEQYIDDTYVETCKRYDIRNRKQNFRSTTDFDGEVLRPSVSYRSVSPEKQSLFQEKMDDSSAEKQKTARSPQGIREKSLDEILETMIDESFSEMLLRKIDEKGMKDSECYKKANIDRKLFSKIRSNPYYKPSKPTVLAFAVALELSLDETRDMLMKAGFALSHSSKFDIIVEYFIKKGNYNIFDINEALFAFDQSLLGS